jgi:hypothetical protein
VSFFLVVKILFKGTAASLSRCKLRKAGPEIIEEITDKMLIGWSSASGS